MIRKAVVTDALAIKKLIEPFVKEGLMLPKSLYALHTAIRDFSVMVDDQDGLIGCCALQISWADTGEIRTLAVSKEVQGRGLGRLLVNACLQEARELKLSKIFTLTYVPDFFLRNGFSLTDKTTLPSKIWADCIHCPHFPDCNETALEYILGEENL